MRKIMKKSKNILALGLALVLFIGNMANVSASFDAGYNSKNYKYGNTNGYVSILTDVSLSNGVAVGYKIKGTIHYDAIATLKIVVKGYYYDSRGFLCNYGDSAEAGTDNLTAGGYVPGVGVCDSSHRCSSKGYVFNDKVATVYYPKK